MDNPQMERKTRPSEEGRDFNARLTQDAAQAPDAPTLNDGRVNVASEHLDQTASGDGEVAPEFGDAADPSSEQLRRHHRDE